MDAKETLLSNIDKLHTTELGIDRIKKNLGLSTNDVVAWCTGKIKKPDCDIIKKGKNFYATVNHCIITINSYSYTIITAHKVKNKNIL